MSVQLDTSRFEAAMHEFARAASARGIPGMFGMLEYLSEPYREERVQRTRVCVVDAIPIRQLPCDPPRFSAADFLESQMRSPADDPVGYAVTQINDACAGAVAGLDAHQRAARYLKLCSVYETRRSKTERYLAIHGRNLRFKRLALTDGEGNPVVRLLPLT